MSGLAALNPTCTWRSIHPYLHPLVLLPALVGTVGGNRQLIAKADHIARYQAFAAQRLTDHHAAQALARLDSGQIRYTIDWPGLLAEEKQDGWILPCVALADSDVVITSPGASPLMG